MAVHKKWRITYFSTPSSIMHDAYKFWSGEDFNKGRRKSEHIKLNLSHQFLQHGRRGEDGQFRQIITINDVVAQGFDLFDLEQIKREYSEADFKNLFLCEFVDDTQSIFPLAALEPCMVDSAFSWDDYKPFAARPLANRSVWIGYDPSDTGDSAGCVVVSPPNINGGKFRVLEFHQWRGMKFAEQAASIKKLCEKYQVTHIGIDATGLGLGVFELVKQFFPAVQAFKYSVEVKQSLVFKLQDVIRCRRLEFDVSARDLAYSLMSIRKTLTKGGKQMTFTTLRTEEASHGDLAWALMHAIAAEPLTSTAGDTSRRSFVDWF